MEESLQPLAAWLERHARLAAALLAFLLLIAIGVAAHKLFWYDELITGFTASLPTTGDLLRFYSDGLDTTSPVASLLAHAGMHLPELAVRFPFMLAFLGAPVGLYGFMRRRYSAGYALAALVFPLAFPGFAYFMTEARAYALMMRGRRPGHVFLAVCRRRQGATLEHSWPMAGAGHCGGRPFFCGLSFCSLCGGTTRPGLAA
ncbi:MAG: hypothetical protein WA532_07275 [Candidatus Korobacteraceae bacterium]